MEEPTSADWTLLEAALWLAERDRAPEEHVESDGALRHALGALQEMLAAGKLTASGVIDASPRGPISAASWRFTRIELEYGFFAGHDAAGESGTAYLKIYGTDAVPARALHDLSQPAGWNGPDGQPAYHRWLTEVTVPRAEMERIWPLDADPNASPDPAEPIAQAPHDTPTPRRGGRKSLAALEALKALYPDGVPETVNNKVLTGKVIKHIKQRDPTFTVDEKVVRAARVRQGL